MHLRFGTDGVRGRAFEQLTEVGVEALGAAAAAVFGADRYYIGRDTRESGPRLADALRAGLAGGGATVIDLGVAPTPAVAWLAAADGVPGAVISASHNPFHDNGVKFFAPGGRKLTDAQQDDVQARLDRAGSAPRPDARASAPVLGAAVDGSREVARYADAVSTSLGGRSLAGVRVVIDCANGAASDVAPGVLRALGADVEVLFAEPDGRNINDGCGSTHPEVLQAAVVARGAAAGLAFDGDADRVLAVDADGTLVDGDQILAICSIDLAERGRLQHDTVVVTVMTNLGFRLAMRERGIQVVDTAVGDRYVLEALEAGGFSLGGEQSGHVIFRDMATTGDGLLTGVQLLDVMVRSGTTLGALAGAAMRRLPQVLRNVRVDQVDPTIVTRLAPDIARVEARLGATGRVLVRTSGTEPLIRVMVEAEAEEVAAAAAAELVDAVRGAASPIDLP
jgi:phosphoglucosamine mutase